MPDFSTLADPAQVGASWINAFQLGQQQRQQTQTQEALKAYAQNMTPQAAAAVSRANPQLGIQLQDRETQRQAAEQQKQVTMAALNGDPEARRMLAYYNSDLYMKLDEQHKKQVDQTMGAIAQQAFSILQLPKDQQEPALQQALAGLQAQGLDVSQFHLSGNPEADLKSALAMTGHLDDYEKWAQGSNQAIQGGGGLFNVSPVNGVTPLVVPNTGGAAPMTPAVQTRQGPDGKTYYGVGGRWFDNPQEAQQTAGGTSGNAGGNFPNISRYYGGQ